MYFDASHFKPEEISVGTEDNRLVVRAQKSVDGKKASKPEWVGRSIPLPPSVDRDRIHATLTKVASLSIYTPIQALTHLFLIYSFYYFTH